MAQSLHRSFITDRWSSLLAEEEASCPHWASTVAAGHVDCRGPARSRSTCVSCWRELPPIWGTRPDCLAASSPSQSGAAAPRKPGHWLSAPPPPRHDQGPRAPLRARAAGCAHRRGPAGRAPPQPGRPRQARRHGPPGPQPATDASPRPAAALLTPWRLHSSPAKPLANIETPASSRRDGASVGSALRLWLRPCCSPAQGKQLPVPDIVAGGARDASTREAEIAGRRPASRGSWCCAAQPLPGSPLLGWFASGRRSHACSRPDLQSCWGQLLARASGFSRTVFLLTALRPEGARDAPG